MRIMLPQPFDVASQWSWPDYEPHYQALMAVELNETNIDEWIKHWTAFYSTFVETKAWLRLQIDLDSTDEDADEHYQSFMRDIFPPMETALFELKNKLVNSALVPDGMNVTIRQMQAQNDIFREENLPIQVKVDEVARQYGRIAGTQSIEWDGEEKTLVQMKQFNAHPDRAVREQAWRAIANRQQQDRAGINTVWQQLMALRKQLYENAGLNNYREYAWKDRQRLDYTPEDAVAFTEAIEQVVVPALARQREKRRQRMRLAVLRPWDVPLEPHDMAPDLSKRPSGNVYNDEADLIQKAAAVFNQLDPELGGFFQTMRDSDWLNLENRKGKRPGAYCTTLPVSKGAFIFGNASGKAPDVSMVFHESGHAFHAFYTANNPLISTRRYPLEYAEVASTSMELLALPYLMKDKGGFFDESEAARYVLDQIEEMIPSWAYQAVVIAFQHWAYTHHELASDPAECDRAWSDLWYRYSPNVDFSGLEDWVATGWHRKQHIFTSPFYYIEYGLAQLGAVQIWRNSLTDQAQALESYRAGLKLGNRVTLPALFAASGARLAFDAATLQEAVDLIESQVTIWEERIS